MGRVLAICLDGYEESVGRELMRNGQMPHLASISDRSCRFLLEHGPALRTGLAGEHFATGRSPELADRWAAVHFDPQSFSVWQEGTSTPPFPVNLTKQTLVFDPPYFDLELAPRVQGLVNWGAHDPGVESTSRPAGILSEVLQRFGNYPAGRWIYGTPWSSETRTREMGSRLAAAVRVRADVAEWLLRERLPEWDLAIVTVSEAHSAIEGLWHGIDASHPLHHAASAGAAGEGLRRVYLEIDQLIGKLAKAFSDAILVVFSMHGMGSNKADVASMLLLPELLFRNAFGRSYFDRRGVSEPRLNGCPTLGDEETWDQWVAAGFDPNGTPRPASSWRSLASAMLPGSLKRLLRPYFKSATGPRERGLRLGLDWMPATRYQRFWREMPAFALPSFYDGRIRVNLKGRERNGIIEPHVHSKYCEEMIELVKACKDPITGQGVVGEVERPATKDPARLGATEADLVFIWQGAPLGFEHPRLGRIGPVPYRRTGGHTGLHGFAFVAGSGLPAGDYGERSSYDVVPTLFDLLEEPFSGGLSGTGLLSRASTSAAWI